MSVTKAQFVTKINLQSGQEKKNKENGASYCVHAIILILTSYHHRHQHHEIN
jgi:hypothetical protein